MVERASRGTDAAGMKRLVPPAEDGAVGFVDERLGASPLIRKAMRYVFPDHWSFLLGEIALYAFMVLIGTGIYLALLFDPSTSATVYHGAFAPLIGQSVSHAFASRRRSSAGSR